MNWTNDIENILNNIRINSIKLNKSHKKEYFKMKHKLNYFKMPIIILSSINSVISVGLNTYLEQQYLNGLICILSLTTTIISSIELYLKVNDNLELELNQSKDYYLLSTSIYEMLSLDRNNRNIDGLEYLKDKIAIYNNLFEKSNILKYKISDELQSVEINHIPLLREIETPKSESEIEI